MERRIAIKKLLFYSGGIILLPSCLGKDEQKASVKLKNLNIDGNQELLLAEIAETIIPETDTPGAKALGVHLFVLKMVDDCYEKADQEAFLTGLAKLDDISRQQHQKSFVLNTRDNRESILGRIEADKKGETALSIFYKIMKKNTILGYTNSKYVMTNLVIYRLIPNKYNGYFPVANNKTNHG